VTELHRTSKHLTSWPRRLIRFLWRHGIHYGGQLLLLVVACALFAGGAMVLWVATLQIPDFNGFEERLITQSTKIYDRTGKVLLFDAHQDIRRTIVPSEDISRNIKNAAVAIEDGNFYNHRGIEPTSILRAFLANLGSGRLSQGGSTITQQVIKNSLLTQEKKLSRKIKEAILALKIERILSKDQILGLYLNESPYGGNLYGVEEASLAFFGKRAADVNLAEAAYLAALPNAPTYFSPYGNHVDALEVRKNLVLRRMAELGFITKTEEEEAKAEKVHFASADNRSIKAPHFVMYVKSYLEAKYSKEIVESSGLKVRTSLDWSMQQKAEAAAKQFAPDIESRFGARNLGIVGTDPKTGHVLFMVGSRDYFDTDHEGNFNVTIAHRQPGSTFKPFVYATAFMKGYTPDTVVFDLQTEFNANCTPSGAPQPGVDANACYMPQNYDEKYRGPISLRNALAQSVNIPAIKTLYLAGIKDSITTARSMGIRGLTTAARYGLTLVLGGGEVSPLDLTEAYGVFANDGVRNTEAIILQVEDNTGSILEEWQPAPVRVLSEQVARQITDILTDNEARAPAFGAASALYIPEREVAVKTGTTNNYRDVWIMAYTPSLSMGIWAGNNDNTPINKKVAGFVVAPIMNSLMRTLLPALPEEIFPKPEPVVQNNKPILHGVWQGGQEFIVDTSSQALATQETPPEFQERRVVPSVHSILYWVNKTDPLGPAPTHPTYDPQFTNWETPVRAWALAQKYIDGTSAVIPQTTDTAHTRAARPTIVFDLPTTTSTYKASDRVTVRLLVKSIYPAQQAIFFFNNVYLGTSNTIPFSFTFIPNTIDITTDVNTIKAIVTDSVGNKSEASTVLNLST